MELTSRCTGHGTRRGSGTLFAPGTVTRGQLRDLGIGLHRFGLSNRDRCIGFCSCVVGRPLASRKELSAREASLVLDHLERLRP